MSGEGEGMRRHAAGMVWSLCGILDAIPVRRDGRWSTAQWGCWPLRLSSLALRIEGKG